MHDLTALASMDHAGIAAFMRAETLLGGPDEVECDDPGVLVLWTEIGQFMLGVCHLLAFHLKREHGLEVVVLEGLSRYGCWDMRHVAVTTLGVDEIRAALAVSDGGFDIPIVDAIGDGTFDERLRLYDGSEEYRVVHADGVSASYLNGIRDLADEPVPYDPVERLPGLALALGREFDLASALALIVTDLDRPGADGIPGLEALSERLGVSQGNSRHR